MFRDCGGVPHDTNRRVAKFNIETLFAAINMYTDTRDPVKSFVYAQQVLLI